MNIENNSDSSTNIIELSELLTSFQKTCGQIEISLSKNICELVEVYNLQWEIGLKAERSGPLDPQEIQQYQHNKLHIEEVKKNISKLTQDKETLLNKIKVYEQYIAILSDRNQS